MARIAVWSPTTDDNVRDRNLEIAFVRSLRRLQLETYGGRTDDGIRLLVDEALADSSLDVESVIQSAKTKLLAKITAPYRKADPELDQLAVDLGYESED